MSEPRQIIVNGISLPRRTVIEEALRQRKWRFVLVLLLFPRVKAIDWPVEERS